MLKGKLFWTGVVLSAVIAAGASYRLVTGQCPVAAICHCLHGDAKTPAN